MRILAVADVHSPRFIEKFSEGILDKEPPDLFLMAGDMVNRGRATEYPRVLDVIEEHLGSGFPIYGCFGNEEYSEVRNKIISLVDSRMTFLDEKSDIVKIDGLRIGIVGTQGSLDKPTSWQRGNIPSIKRIFQRRAARASSLLKKLRKKKVDYSILLMHYAPCLETCEGEHNRDFAWLGSRKFYTLLVKQSPDLVIHGHVHQSTRHQAKIGPTLVRNVALPAVGTVTDIEIWEKPEPISGQS